MSSMRPSLFLAVLALFGHFAYGFSSPPTIAHTSFGARATAAAASSGSIHPKSVAISSTGAMVSSVAISRGGAIKSATYDDDENNSAFKIVSSTWGTMGVVYILAKAIRRVLPIALEPFLESSTPLSSVQLGAYIITCAWFAYVEGYKGFQTKFAPLVVSRSRTIGNNKSKQRSLLHFVFAPLYSMGLFYATKKRLIVSWSVTVGVAAIVALVKRMAYPWRNIIDAGVVAGLSWGSVSILLLYVKSLYQGKSPDIDPALPKGEKTE